MQIHLNKDIEKQKFIFLAAQFLEIIITAVNDKWAMLQLGHKPDLVFRLIAMKLQQIVPRSAPESPQNRRIYRDHF